MFLRLLLFFLMLICSSEASAQTRASWLDLKDRPAYLVTAPGVVDVKTFGAVGDGVTDDRAAIQNAIDYCLASGTVLFISPPQATKYYRIASIHPATVGTASPSALLIKHPTSSRHTLTIIGAEKDRGYQTTRGIYADFESVSAPWSLIRNEQDGINSENVTFSGRSVPVLFQDSAGAFKRFINVTFDCGYGTTRPTIGLYIPQTYLSTLENCLFRDATVAGLQIGDGTLVTTSTSIKNSYASTSNSTGSDIGFYLRRMVYSSIINCAVDFYQVGYHIDGGASGAQTFTIMNCGAEFCFSPVVYFRTELVVDSFYSTDTTGPYVFETLGDVAGFNVPEIRGSIRRSWTAEAIASGTNKLLKGNFRVLTPGIDRRDISLTAYPITDRNTCFVADSFRGYKAKVSSGNVLNIPIAGNLSGYYPSTIEVKGIESGLLSATVGRDPYTIDASINIIEFNGNILSASATKSLGVSSVATATNVLQLNLANTYTSGTELIVNFNSSTNSFYVDFASSTFGLN